MEEFNPGVDRVWSSFASKGAETLQQPDVLREFNLPKGFVTEKGSRYSYKSDGGIHREKFDGTRHEAGIAVFIADTDENLDTLSRLSAISDHIPPEMRKKPYILQLDYKKNTARKIYKTVDVVDPSSLAFALISGRGQIESMIPASLQPQLGDYVFEMDKLPDGSTMRHPGHRVSDILHR